MYSNDIRIKQEDQNIKSEQDDDNTAITVNQNLTWKKKY